MFLAFDMDDESVVFDFLSWNSLTAKIDKVDRL